MPAAEGVLCSSNGSRVRYIREAGGRGGRARRLRREAGRKAPVAQCDATGLWKEITSAAGGTEGEQGVRWRGPGTLVLEA